MPQPEPVVRVLDHDPGLAAVLEPADRESARRSAVAPLLSVPRGVWQAPVAARDPRRDLGLLVVSGLLARNQEVAGRVFTELLGPEDLLRPWDDANEAGSIEGHVSWAALQPTSLAWLDGDFASTVAQWQEITSALVGRAIRRTRLLSFRTALLEITRVDLRVLLLMWQLADRWGRVHADGVHLDLPLTHELIGRMVGAHRTTVTLAVKSLRDDGLLERSGAGTWLLLGGAPQGLSDTARPIAPRPATETAAPATRAPRASRRAARRS
jgi:CRP-like cAMP-binding protein